MAFEFFDKVFQQPDVCEDLDEQPVVLTTYPATAVRKDDVWSAEVHDLPGDLTVRVEGKTWIGVEMELMDRVPQLLEASEGSVNVLLRPTDQEATEALRALSGARQDRAVAEQAERDAARRAARLLASKGWNAEDTGSALRLPTERIEKILAEPARATVRP